MSRDAVVTRLTESLDGVAGRFDPAVPRFDPARSPSVALPGEAAAGRPRSRRRLVVAAAAVVALVAGVASVVALRHDDPAGDTDDVRTSSETPSRPVDAPDGALVPTWLPEGMEVWSTQWWHPRQRGSGSGGPARDQVFTAGDGRRVKLEIRHGVFPVDDGSGRTVRGQTAAATGTGTADAPTAVSWLEEGDVVQAWALGLGVDEVIAFLDGLQRRSTGVLRGFDPPAGSDLRPAGEAFRTEGEHRRTGLAVVYGRGMPSAAGPDDRLLVETVAPTGEPSLPYVDARFWGTTRPDGTAVVERDGGWTWERPDGSSVTVTPQSDVMAEDVERLVASVAPATSADLVELRAEAEAWAAGTPAVAEATFSSGIAVELRGAGDFLQVCARFRGDDGLRCSGSTGFLLPVTTGGTNTLLTGFVDDDGRWYAVAATTGQPGTDWRPTSPPADPGTVAPTERATSGGWTIGVYPVPDGVTEVGWGPATSTGLLERRDWAR